jgi:hypothetical protein
MTEMRPPLPVTGLTLHWVRNGSEYAVWQWTASSGIWHAMPFVLFYDARKAAKAAWVYLCPAIPRMLL